jgi:SulP family sulfate permease
MVPDPDDPGRRLTEISQTDLMECPQLRILRISGSLFFGAANHVSEILEESDDGDPRHLLIIGYGINFIDVSGSLVLEQEAYRRLKLGRHLFLCRLNRVVIRFLTHGGFLKEIGQNRVFTTENQAISEIFNILDKSICRTCTARIFEECQSVTRPNILDSYAETCHE